jgi:hypothetical protein
VNDLTRRSFLQLAAAATIELYAGSLRAADDANAGERYITSFYQFNHDALRRFRQHDALPNGPRFEHIFCQSTGGTVAHPELTRQVHAAGESFKFAWAYDAHKHKGWERAGDDDLMQWARAFRDAAFNSADPPDYFAFNEMPSTGHSDPETRDRITKLIRFLNDPGDGPKWPGLFYFVEENSRVAEWRGDSIEFWETLDQTCQHVVAEHYHTDTFVFNRTLQEFSDHLFAFPRWMRDSNHAPRVNIAQHKFAVLHSSYWGRGYDAWTSLYRDLRLLRFHPSADAYKVPHVTPWEGLLSEMHDSSDLEKYFERCVAATRLDELGKTRIAFSPLAIGQPLGSALMPLLAKVLGKDAARFGKES